MPIRPIVFFDTSVCIDLAHFPEAHDWPRIRKCLGIDFRYRIAPVTVYELVAGLATGGDAHFDRNRKAIRVLYDPRQKKIFPPVRSFVLQTLFGDRLPTTYSADLDFRLWIKAVLQAPSRAVLQSGQLKLANRPGTFGLALREINQNMRRIQEGYAKHFKRFLDAKVPKLTRDVWADLIVSDYRKPSTDENRQLISERLDAAFRFDESLCWLARSKTFNFLKHKSEIGDAQQLYYLCDPHVYFVTNERKLKNRLAASSQAEQIITYSDLRTRVSR